MTYDSFQNDGLNNLQNNKDSDFKKYKWRNEDKLNKLNKILVETQITTMITL